MRLVGSKCTSCEPPGPASIVRPPVLETTCQSNGATTCSVNVRLEVGLVEAGEHPLGVGRLELRVEVDLPVLRVLEAVQALAAVGVAAVGGDHQRVLLGEVGQRQAAVLGVAADVELDAVEGGRVHRLGDQVDERVRARPCALVNSTVVIERNVRSPGWPAPSVTSSCRS